MINFATSVDHYFKFHKCSHHVPLLFATKLCICLLHIWWLCVDNYCTIESDTMPTENERGSGVEPKLMLEWLSVIVVPIPLTAAVGAIGAYIWRKCRRHKAGMVIIAFHFHACNLDMI